MMQQKQYGIVHFNSDPSGALIYIDGQLLVSPDEEPLRTPSTAKLLEGRRDFIFSLEGYEDTRGYVDIFPNTTVNIFKRMKKGTSGGGWGAGLLSRLSKSRYLDVEDFLKLSFDQKLYLFSLGYTIQSPAYELVPRQLPTQMGYLGYIPDHLNRGDTFPVVMSMTGLASEPIDFYLTLDGETIFDYPANIGENSCSFLHKVTESDGCHIMEAWVVDNSGQVAKLDSKQYTVGNNIDKNNYKTLGLILLVSLFFGL